MLVVFDILSALAGGLKNHGEDHRATHGGPLDGEFVVFLIGMRVNKPWKVHKWLPVFLAMPRMIKELEANPDSGFLGHNGLAGKVMVQYWRSFDHLEAYARPRDKSHWPAWVDFNERVGASRGDVGIWHETYCIRPGQYKAIYSGMPPYGLGRIGKLAPASGRGTAARERLGSRGKMIGAARRRSSTCLDAIHRRTLP